MLKITAISILLTQGLTFGCETLCVCDSSEDHVASTHEMSNHGSATQEHSETSDRQHESGPDDESSECAMTACMTMVDPDDGAQTIAVTLTTENKIDYGGSDVVSRIPPEPPPPRFS
jgi:hypothetical protein